MEQQIKILKTIHLALLTGVTIAYFVIGDVFNLSIPKLEGENLYYIFIPAIAVLVSNFLFKNAVSKINTRTDDQQKMAQYQTACVLRWAILEGGAFLILFLKPKLILFGLLLLFYLLLVRPTEDNIKNTLDIK